MKKGIGDPFVGSVVHVTLSRCDIESISTESFFPRLRKTWLILTLVLVFEQSFENRCNTAFPVCKFSVENESRMGSNGQILEINKKKPHDDGDKNSSQVFYILQAWQLSF